MESAWTDLDSYVAGSDDYDIHTIVTNTGPEPAVYQLSYSMIAEDGVHAGEELDHLVSLEIYELWPGEELEVAEILTSSALDVPASRHWIVETWLSDRDLVDQDWEDNVAQSNSFEVTRD